MKGTPSHDSKPKVKRRGKSFLTVYRKKKKNRKKQQQQPAGFSNY